MFDVTATSAPSALTSEAENPSLLIDAEECARLAGMSVSSWHKQRSLGRVPKPIRIGRMVRWLRQEILDWLKDGCPVPKPHEEGRCMKCRAV